MPLAPDALAPLTFLVVDDEAFMRTLISRVLKGLGAATVIPCEDGRAALDIVPTGADVILCDLNMPGMDGVEFLRHLTQTPFMGAVVLISGEDQRVLSTAENLAKAHDLNVLGALSKPITPAGLSDLLAKLGDDGLAGRRRQGPVDRITEDDLRRGIENDDLVVFFQPKVRVRDRKVVGVESLVRWQHQTRGLVPPMAFIPVAEDLGLIDALTDSVYAKAVRQGGRWLTAGHDIKVAVNISVDSLTRFDLPEMIVATAAAEGLDPSHIVLEVTESRLMHDIRSSLEILTRLRLKGVGLSIDDFGTGHSSLHQLKRIPFTELKIDRAFVFGAARDPAARAILDSSVGLARSLGMSTVAEGAETQEDWDLVESLGVDMVQGYVVAKPMPADQFDAWLTAWEA
ncbi:EAL domain-containing response regulator [Roseospira visakhapatnamensis]|uniref:EAL domain-containing protein (Putative c-di-GMP-specific phosphodiesterase class I)/ActR/RegA family two-component response regulator n=1 Tax=Roseospira visakhapatnamensis TaxID=390880 RepID=A0A7W6RD71_9PROT|nr:EAL domain-containing response regulator [Roseospira visakhapatnamensis]MBB4265859.1 EAL domain-containing protein (putative c-di-GMP-specific phosphodiesterase class I)/ActR/RegA family two-component response regulator [Roseospira visakhapatnamensis]